MPIFGKKKKKKKYSCKKNHAFKKYQLQGKFMFQQLDTNFSDFWQNNSVIMQNILHLQNKCLIVKVKCNKNAEHKRN